MPFRPPKKSQDYNRLTASLVNSGFQKENNPLFQAVNGLINGAQDLSTGLNGKRDLNSKIVLPSEVSGELLPKNGGAKYGSFFPTFTNTTNVSSFTTFFTQFLTAGRIVYVSGKIEITPSSSGVQVNGDVELPVASNFTDSGQVNGMAAIDALTAAVIIPGIVTGDVATKGAKLRFISADTNLHDCRFTFSYELV
jgi:hypothetical protein